MKIVSITGDAVKSFINVQSVNYINIKVYNYISIKGDKMMNNVQKIIEETKVLAALELFKQVAVDLCDTGDEELADILYRGVKILEIGCERKQNAATKTLYRRSIDYVNENGRKAYR